MKKTVMKFSVSGFPADSDSVDNLLLLLEEIEGYSFEHSMDSIITTKDSDDTGGLKFTDFMEVGKTIKAFCLKEGIIKDATDNSRFAPLEDIVIGGVQAGQKSSFPMKELVKVPENDEKIQEVLSALSALGKLKGREITI